MKKFVLSAVVCLFLLVSSLGILPQINKVFAAASSADPVNDCPPYPIISTCNLRFIMQTNVATLGEMLVGKPGDPQASKNSATGGLINGIGLMIQSPPVSARKYVAYMSGEFHIPGTPTAAYAAGPGGYGFGALDPVIKIWVVTRNLAYFAFAIFFVIAGIMIMLRSKIDPKTATTIQSTLPKIVVALLLVSFSYAIAGLLVDLMYVALGLVLTIAGSIEVTLTGCTSSTNCVGPLGQNILQGNIFTTVFQQVTFDTIGNAAQSLNIAIQSFFDQGSSLSAVSGQLIGFLGGAIGFLIIALAIVWALFQTWLKLLSAYANILLAVIMAPVRIMFDALPGQNQFDGWLREMLSYLLAFPAVLAMILIGMILANTNSGNTGAYNGFVPPLIGDNNQQAVQALIGIAILLTIPKTIDMLQQMLKAPKNAFGDAWGEAIGGGTRIAGAGREIGGTPFRMRAEAMEKQYKGDLETWQKNPAAPGPRPEEPRSLGLMRRLGGGKPT